MLFTLIKKTILHNKVLVSFMILSTLLTSTIGCFVYGVYQNYSEKLNEGNELARIIEIGSTGSAGIKTKHKKYVRQAEENNFDFSQAYSIITKKDLIDTLIKFPKNLMKKIDFIDCSIIADDNIYDINCYYFNLKSNDKGVYPVNTDAGQFTDEQYEKGERVVRIPHILYTSGAKDFMTGTLLFVNDGGRQISKDEKYIEINNEKYRIIGESVGINDDSLHIPFTSLPDDTPLAGVEDTVYIWFKKSVTAKDFNEVKNIFETNLSGKAVVNNMDLSELSDKSYYKTMLLISAVITILFSINLAMIYKFVVESNRRCVAIFRLCGCSKRKSVFLFLCQALIITAPFFIISQIIFDKILYIKLLNVFPLMEDSFSINVYAIMFFTYLLVSAGILYVLIRRRIGNKINFKEDLR